MPRIVTRTRPRCSKPLDHRRDSPTSAGGFFGLRCPQDLERLQARSGRSACRDLLSPTAAPNRGLADHREPSDERSHAASRGLAWPRKRQAGPRQQSILRRGPRHSLPSLWPRRKDSSPRQDTPQRNSAAGNLARPWSGLGPDVPRALAQPRAPKAPCPRRPPRSETERERDQPQAPAELRRRATRRPKTASAQAPLRRLRFARERRPERAKIGCELAPRTRVSPGVE